MHVLHACNASSPEPVTGRQKLGLAFAYAHHGLDSCRVDCGDTETVKFPAWYGSQTIGGWTKLPNDRYFHVF